MSTIETEQGRAGTPSDDAGPAPVRQEHAPPPGQDAAPAQRLSRLRLALVITDAVCATVAWATWAVLADVRPSGLTEGPLSITLLAVVLTMACLAALHLYRSRVNSVRAVEIVGLARAVAATLVILQGAKGLLDVSVEPVDLAVGGMATFLALVLGRRGFRMWLTARRRRGEHLRPVVVVGTDQEGQALVAMLRRNPDAGYRVIGLVGDADGVANNGAVPWLGPTDAAAEVVASIGATGAFLAASALTPTQLNRTARELMADGHHVHLSNALRGIAARRIRLQPISREMMFYLEPAQLRRWEQQVKRTIDVVLASLGIVVLAPILAVAAVLIRLHDRGPALFCQERVGRDGSHFKLYKLRTMVLDAESRLSELHDRNERDGVLFKVENDPRVTPVGRLLRATSIDELPQLVNVLRGEMSLVGPRPALPSEVDCFDERLRSRHDVSPGVTGLWQVEARDVPGLGAYTRLDLFYVENWSVMLDLTIIVSTVSHVVGRAVRIVLRRSSSGT